MGLCVHTLHLAENNKAKYVLALITMAHDCINRVLNLPSEDKFWSIKTKPYFKKVGAEVDGGVEYLRLLGFKANEKNTLASLPSKKGIDTELLRLRLTESERAWKLTKQ